MECADLSANDQLAKFESNNLAAPKADVRIAPNFRTKEPLIKERGYMFRSLGLNIFSFPLLTI
jgi:hypothetical protein